MIKQRPKNKLYDVSYRRLDKEKESRSDSEEETELYVKYKSQRKEIPTVEKNVEDGDTLQSLAIRYHCTIADLKRINNIHRENEIFAKRTIKVPQRFFSVALAGIHISGTSSPESSSQPSTSNLIDIDLLSSKLSDALLTVPNGKKDEVNEIIFNSNITQKPCDNISEQIIEGSCEAVHLLPRRDSVETETMFSKLSCSGVDGDISWIALFVCIMTVILAVPLIYVFYIAEHPEEYHHPRENYKS